MDSADIIHSLNRYNNDELKSPFLNETISYFKRLNNSRICIIEEDEYMLAGIRLHILYNNFYFYLSSKKPDNIVSYRKLTLSKNQVYNLENQLYGIKKETFNICNNEKTQISKSYFIISQFKLTDKNMTSIPLSMALGLIGINSLKFLEYQNLKNYCILSSKSEKIFKDLIEYKKMMSELKWQERDRLLLINDIILNAMGTRPASDIKILLVSNNSQKSSGMKTLIKKFNIIELNQKTEDIESMKESEYALFQKAKWLVNKMPSLSGAPDINTMLINTKYHFYFMGIKFISIFANINKTIYKSNYQSFLDVYLLKIINNLDCFNTLCIKNITFTKGETNLNNNESIDLMYKNIHNFAKKSYKIDIPISYIKQHLTKCADKFDTIYKNRVKYVDPLIREQIKIHRQISNYYIFKYGRNKESLLDMGSGKLSGSWVYGKANIKNVYGVEPSIYSIELAKEMIKKNSKTKFTLINAFADKQLNIDVKFDIITFIFTIHYMLKNLNIVIDNIKKLSKVGTIIIITCVNGDKISEKLSNSDSYEIKYYNSVYWGVYKFNSKDIKNDTVLFYMKDVYGLELGSEEYLVPVNSLIENFQKNNIRLKYNNSFKNEYNKIPNSSKLKTFQYDILNMQNILIFENMK